MAGPVIAHGVVGMPGYTPHQVSEMLSIPESSLRRLARQFADFLSPQPGRNRRYLDSDVQVLRRIREATGRGRSLDEIRADLLLVQDVPAQPAPADTLALVPTVAGELARLDDQYRAVLRQLEQLQSDRAADRDRLQAVEAWLRLPWWRRLFTRPPGL